MLIIRAAFASPLRSLGSLRLPVHPETCEESNATNEDRTHRRGRSGVPHGLALRRDHRFSQGDRSDRVSSRGSRARSASTGTSASSAGSSSPIWPRGTPANPPCWRCSTRPTRPRGSRPPTRSARRRTSSSRQEGRKADIVAILDDAGKIVGRDLNPNADVGLDLKAKYPAVARRCKGVAVKDVWTWQERVHEVAVAPGAQGRQLRGRGHGVRAGWSARSPRRPTAICSTPRSASSTPARSTRPASCRASTSRRKTWPSRRR